jgi:ParB-like chromosome segregation protein Spo0J
MKVTNISVEELKPHPLNRVIYADGPGEELVDSIREKGILTPLLITPDNTIVSGHRRLMAAKVLKIPSVPAIVSDVTDPIEVEERLILSNRQREKSNFQKAKEYEHLKAIEEQKAKARQEATRFGNGTDGTPVAGSAVGGKFPAPKGRARDIAAKALGMSGRTAEKGSKVLKKAEELKTSGKKEEAAALIDTLDRSVDAAYKAVTPDGNERPDGPLKSNERELSTDDQESTATLNEPEHPKDHMHLENITPSGEELFKDYVPPASFAPPGKNFGIAWDRLFSEIHLERKTGWVETPKATVIHCIKLLYDEAMAQ